MNKTDFFESAQAFRKMIRESDEEKRKAERQANRHGAPGDVLKLSKWRERHGEQPIQVDRSHDIADKAHTVFSRSGSPAAKRILGSSLARLHRKNYPQPSRDQRVRDLETRQDDRRTTADRRVRQGLKSQNPKLRFYN